jgi:hypothetical protein
MTEVAEVEKVGAKIYGIIFKEEFDKKRSPTSLPGHH